MTMRSDIVKLCNTLYGTRDIDSLSPKQTAILKAILKDKIDKTPKKAYNS